MDQKIQAMATRLSNSLDVNMRKAFLPDETKALRLFNSTEVANILGVSQDFLRKLFFDGKVNPGDIQVDARGRRFYTAEQIDILRQEISRLSTKYQDIVPRRRPGEHLQVLSVVNFKGGSGKSTSAIHIAQKLALDGYRVLCGDLDPQASMTTMFGFRPEVDFPDTGTIYDALRYEDPVPMRDIILKTYFHNLDLAPAGLLLSEFETETAHALQSKIQPPFFQRLALSLGEVEEDYDVVILDCPPQLGFTTLAALMASTSVIVTVIPSMLDVASMAQFLRMTASLMATIADFGVRPDWDFMKFLITRYEPNDGPQAQMAGFLRTMFADDVMTQTFLKSSAVSDAGLTQQTLYEIARSDFHRQTYDRAMESINGVVGEVENLMKTAWGRKV